jgi:hypothetical protein
MQTTFQPQAFRIRSADFDARLIRLDEAARLVGTLQQLLRTPRLEAQSSTAGRKFRTALFGFREALHNHSLGFTPEAKRFLSAQFAPALLFQTLVSGAPNALPKELLILADRTIAHLSVGA